MEKINDILSKVKIPVASHGRHPHKFSFPILETSEWMVAHPIYTRELRKGDSINFASSLFSRTDALLNPAFVTGNYHYRFFFVPYNLVQKSYHSVMERTRYSYSDGTFGFPDHVRRVDLGEICNQIVNNTALCTLVKSTDPFDFQWLNGSLAQYYKFTAEGSRLYQLLRGLGYKPRWIYEQDWKDALPMLSWLAVWRDWFYPDQYAAANPQYSSLDSFLKTDTAASLDVNALQMLGYLYDSLQLFYLDDTLSSVWDTPNYGAGQPFGDSSNNFYIPDPTDTGGQDTAHVQNSDTLPAPTIETNSGVLNQPITQFLLDALQSVNNWLLRRKLAGGRLIQRYLASHGVPISDPQTLTSVSLGHKVIPLQIGDVENNSNDNLGELAGKGVARTYDDDLIRCDYTAQDDGLFMLVRYIMPDARLPLAELPSLSRINAVDRFHNEFQKLGVTYVDTSSVFVSNRGNTNDQMNRDFGFAPAYWWEAAEFPRLLGDFELPSRGSEQLSQYHTLRLLDDALFAGQSYQLHHSFDFIRTYDRQSFNRIFYNGEGSNFRNFMFCRVVLRNEKLPNGDSFDWDDDELNRKVELVSKSNV